MTGVAVHPDRDSLPFWQGCERGVLLGQCCGSCAQFRWPPREHCPHCQGTDVDWREIDRRGTVAGAVVLHRTFEPAFADLAPLMIAHVEVDGTGGQMVLIGNLQPTVPVDSAVGRRVGIGFQERAGAGLPCFIFEEVQDGAR